MKTSTLTDRGQVSMPAGLRRAMGLKPGARLRWEAVSNRECRVIVEGLQTGDPVAALGMGARLRKEPGRGTKEWMHELRDGE